MGVTSLWDMPPHWQGRPSALQCLGLTRLVEEALSNTIKHSRARQVRVQCTQPQGGALCLRIEDDGVGFDVQAVQHAAPATGVGALAGGVLGAVVGNQVGKGSGRTAATVLGAVGGGYVGHTVEQRTRTQTVYEVRVRMDDGSVRRFTRAQPVPEGAPVRLQGKGFQLV